jgi:hypothetical protein
MKVTINREQGLYVIPTPYGYSCLGFDVLIERYNRLASEVGWRGFPLEERATLEGYTRYQSLLQHAESLGRRLSCELTPQLAGLERKRVEVIDRYGERRRFIVGKSGGWIPIHLEVKTRRSMGGEAADREYKSVRVVA